MMKDNAIGKNIKKYRIERHITQSELATRIGKKLRTVQKYENGDIYPPYEVIIKLCDVFDIFPTDLLIETVNNIPPEDIDATKNLVKSKEAILERSLLDSFLRLNWHGREEAVKRMTELAFVPEYRLVTLEEMYAGEYAVRPKANEDGAHPKVTPIPASSKHSGNFMAAEFSPEDEDPDALDPEEHTGLFMAAEYPIDEDPAAPAPDPDHSDPEDQ